MYNGSEIHNSYAAGNVNGTSLFEEHFVNFGGDSRSYAGGLIGYIDYAYSTRSLSVKNCWAASSVSLKTENGDGYVGYLCGNYDELLFENCYFSNELSLDADHLIEFGTPATSSDFKNANFYTNKMMWDSTVWDWTKGEYPALR